MPSEQLSCLLFSPGAANVVNLEKPVGHGYKFEELKAAVEQHKPAVLFLCQVSLLSYTRCMQTHAS